MDERTMKKAIAALRLLGLGAACWLAPAGLLPAAKAASTFAIGESDFLLDGKPFQIKAGEMHPAPRFRTSTGLIGCGWRTRWG